MKGDREDEGEGECEGEGEDEGEGKGEGDGGGASNKRNRVLRVRCPTPQNHQGGRVGEDFSQK